MTAIHHRLREAAERFVPGGNSNAVNELRDLAIEASQEIAALRDLLAAHADPAEGRWVVLCDDGSIIATDELMIGDDVLHDRLANGSEALR